MDFLWIIMLAGAVVWFMAAREKRKAEADAAGSQPRQWAETHTMDPETGALVTKFEAPNPATADMASIRDFVDYELFRPKLDHYLKIAKEMNAPAEVIAVIEDRIRRDDERDRRRIEREMEEVDRKIEREIRREFRRK